jgi:hypothetical protein
MENALLAMVVSVDIESSVKGTVRVMAGGVRFGEKTNRDASR